MLMMYTRATFYATYPINAAAYLPVEACGAHEWSYIRRHGCAALAADVAAKPAAALTTAGSAATMLVTNSLSGHDHPLCRSKRSK